MKTQRITTEIAQAADAIRAGQLVAVPTETVYGLAGNGLDPKAVAQIYEVKGRPSVKPLSLMVHDASAMARYCADVPPAAYTLAEAFWPGPLTLVLPRARSVLDAVTGGLDTVALRIPAHPLARAVLEEFGGGIAAPSANRHKKISPTTAQDVCEELGDAVDVLLDGGACRVGIESTIIDLSTGTLRLLRPGAITADDLERTVGEPVELLVDPSIRSPGRMALHYAPNARVVLASMEEVAERLAEYAIPGVHVGVLSEKRAPSWPAHIPWLPLGNSASEQAQQLYRRLRQADGMGLAALIVVPPGDRGMGHALRDRLWRAAGLGAVLA